MAFDQNNNRRKSFNRVRGIMGLSMGIIYLIIAVGVVYFEQKGQINIGKTLSYMIGGLMFFYGIFRIYRGYKQIKGEINY